MIFKRKTYMYLFYCPGKFSKSTRFQCLGLEQTAFIFKNVTPQGMETNSQPSVLLLDNLFSVNNIFVLS